MDTPETSSSELPDFWQSLPSPSYPMQFPLGHISPSLRTPDLRATANVRLDPEKEHGILAFLDNATRSDRWSPLPPYFPLMIDSAEDLANSALNYWKMLCAEIECHRVVFKFCCNSSGAFDNDLFQSYCNRLRLIHNSLYCGMLVALRALLDQLRVWLQVGATTTYTGKASLPDNEVYVRKLRQLVTTLQQLEQNANTVRFPDATALSHDASLMREIYAQHDRHDTRSTTQKECSEIEPSIKPHPVSAASNASDMTECTFTQDQSLPTAQHLFGPQTTNSFFQEECSSAVEEAKTRLESFLSRAKPVDWSDRGEGDGGTDSRAEGEGSMVACNYFGK